MTKRIIALDVICGIAILSVLYFHAIIFTFVVINDGEAIPTGSNIEIITFILAYFVSWAGIFAIVSGLANTFAMYNRFKAGKMPRKQILRRGLLNGVLILILNALYMIVFVPGLEEGVMGIIPGMIRYGNFCVPSMIGLLFNTALTMIGFSNIVTSIVLWIICKDENVQISEKHLGILGAVSIVLILGYGLLGSITTIFLDEFFTPTTAANFLPKMLVQILIGPMNPIFPYAGFTCIGIMMGLMLVGNFQKSSFLKFGYITGVIILILGIILMILHGNPNHNFDTPPFPKLLQLLGGMLLVMTFSIQYHDFCSEEKKIKRFNRTRDIRKFGMLSLSMFLLEGMLVQVLILLVPYSLRSNLMFMSLVFGPIIVVIWAIILRLWKKFSFKYSFEWWMSKIQKVLIKKKSNKLNFEIISEIPTPLKEISVE